MAGDAPQGLFYRPLAAGRAPAPWRRFEAPGFEALAITELKRTFDRGQEELWVLTGDGLRHIRDDGVRL